MASTYKIDKEEFLRNFIKYSVPLLERKLVDDEQQSELEKLADSDTKVKEEALRDLVYLDKYQQERLFGVYSSAIGAYLDRRIEALHDFSDRVPGKHLHTFPISGNEGLYGFTFLGDVHAWRREDLIGSKKGKEIDIHECIHTPNEYETRILTSWIMSKEMPKYIK